MTQDIKEVKTDVPGLYRTSDGALINKDNQALAAYKKRKHKEKRIEEMQSDIQSLKDDLQEIKSLLKGLVK